MKISDNLLPLAALGLGAYYLIRRSEEQAFDPSTATPEERRDSVLAAARAQNATIKPQNFPHRTQTTAPQVLEAAGLEDSGITFSIWKREFETDSGPAEGYRLQVGGPGAPQIRIRIENGAMLSPSESAKRGTLPLAFYPDLDDALEAMTAYISIYQDELLAGE